MCMFALVSEWQFVESTFSFHLSDTHAIEHKTVHVNQKKGKLFAYMHTK